MLYRMSMALALAGLLIGCQRDFFKMPRSGAGAATSLPLMGGYRDENDRCRRVGEDAVTSAFLDDSADLVACPLGVADLSGLDVAWRVAVKDGWVLFSVPRR